MEINITTFYNEACPMDYSASVAEIGNNAGQASWQSATEDASDYNMLDDDDKREAFRDYIKGFGAWSEEEIAAMSDIHLNALLIQMIAGDIRESCLDDDRNDWTGYYAQSEEGYCRGALFMGTDGNIYYYIGD